MLLKLINIFIFLIRFRAFRVAPQKIGIFQYYSRSKCKLFNFSFIFIHFVFSLDGKVYTNIPRFHMQSTSLRWGFFCQFMHYPSDFEFKICSRSVQLHIGIVLSNKYCFETTLETSQTNVTKPKGTKILN